MNATRDHHWMEQALFQAMLAGAMGEVPVGAVLVDTSRSSQGTLLATAGNNCIQACDPTGHAEMRVLRSAASIVRNYRLPKTTLYVTLEPCLMCAAALVHARIDRLVYAASDPKTGAIFSAHGIGLLQDAGKPRPGQNHGFAVSQGLFSERAGTMLKEFFQQKRKKKKIQK